MDCADLVALYSQMLNIALAMLPIAVVAGGLIGHAIGRTLERKRIMKEISTMEDESE